MTGLVLVITGAWSNPELSGASVTNYAFAQGLGTSFGATIVTVGSSLTLDLIWILADIVNGLMAFPNLVALIGLRKEIISETKDYFERLKATQHDQDELA